MAFMDAELCLVRGAYEPYKDSQQRGGEPSSPPPTTTAPNPPAASLGNKQVTRPSFAPRANLGPRLQQLAVLVSEQEVRVVGLPTYRLLQVRRLEIPLVKARVSHLKGYPCLLGLNGTGMIQVYSLPSLRLLHQGQLFPFSLDVDDPVVVKFDFSERGMAMFAASASEVQKLTADAEVAAMVEECSGELFVPCDMPEVPKASFLRGLGTSLFGGSGSNSGGVSPRDTVDLDAICEWGKRRNGF